ncbi:MAG: Trm112 family protein [Myxococcota bacterium]
MSARIDPELLAILVCPKCKGELDVVRAPDGVEQALDCPACELSYPIEDGIPVMLVEEARPRARAGETD